MRTTRMVLSLAILAVLLSAVAAFSAEGIVSIDHIDGGIGHDSLKTGTTLRFVIGWNNNTGLKIDASNGWRVLTPDGAVWDSVVLDSCGPNTVSETSKLATYFQTTCSFVLFPGQPANGPDTVGFLGAGKYIGAVGAKHSTSLPNGYTDTVMAIVVYVDTTKATNDGKHICIDSSFFQPGGTWTWVDTIGPTPHYPTWIANVGGPAHVNGQGYCYLLHNEATSGVTDRGGSLPKSFSISQNYPNPFNPTTKIDFEVPVKSQVRLSVYNVLGQKVTTLVDKAMNPGKYVADWDGRSDGGSTVASGIYFYKFEAGSYVVTKKMIMLK